MGTRPSSFRVRCSENTAPASSSREAPPRAVGPFGEQGWVYSSILASGEAARPRATSSCWPRSGHGHECGAHGRAPGGFQPRQRGSPRVFTFLEPRVSRDPRPKKANTRKTRAWAVPQLVPRVTSRGFASRPPEPRAPRAAARPRARCRAAQLAAATATCSTCRSSSPRCRRRAGGLARRPRPRAGRVQGEATLPHDDPGARQEEPGLGDRRRRLRGASPLTPAMPAGQAPPPGNDDLDDCSWNRAPMSSVHGSRDPRRRGAWCRTWGVPAWGRAQRETSLSHDDPGASQQRTRAGSRR